MCLNVLTGAKPNLWHPPGHACGFLLAASMSSDTYGGRSRSRFHWCAKDKRGEATAFFIACAGRFRSDLGIKAEP